MKKVTLMTAALILMAPLSAVAEGGGGFEYIGNAGSDGIPALARLLSGEEWLNVSSGSIAGFGGFGYGVSYYKFKIGGFGFGFLSGGISKVLPIYDVELLGLAGGFGGLILGTQASAGPIVLALNTRFGAGGISVRQRSHPPSDKLTDYSIGTAALYGNIDAEAGLTINRIMLISVYAGVSGIFAFTFSDPPVLPLLVPNFGVRFTWGSF
ncbi:MAG: hypothetical protein HN368_04600 [Spirochaetales bacterium]|jgi:hypothetical protein|nr:hypothetical protein [Spirochaetales bacterium]